MKKINNTHNVNFLKKLFIKLCRLLGFEIIDQANFRSPTLEKNLNETLNIQGKNLSLFLLVKLILRKKLNQLKSFTYMYFRIDYGSK